MDEQSWLDRTVNSFADITIEQTEDGKTIPEQLTAYKQTLKALFEAYAEMKTVKLKVMLMQSYQFVCSNKTKLNVNDAWLSNLWKLTQ